MVFALGSVVGPWNISILHGGALMPASPASPHSSALRPMQIVWQPEPGCRCQRRVPVQLHICTCDGLAPTAAHVTMTVVVGWLGWLGPGSRSGAGPPRPMRLAAKGSPIAATATGTGRQAQVRHCGLMKPAIPWPYYSPCLPQSSAVRVSRPSTPCHQKPLPLLLVPLAGQLMGSPIPFDAATRLPAVTPLIPEDPP